MRGLVACGLDDPRTCSKHVVTSNDPQADVIHDVWIEDQVIYPRSPVPPQDILTLAKGAHRLAGRYDTLGVVVHFVVPFKWKGQVPKEIHHARVWAVLSDAEKEIVNKAVRGVAPSKRHNVFDAIGIGLWVRDQGVVRLSQ